MSYCYYYVVLTGGGSCWRIPEDSSEIVSELECSHEEADTRMLLHAKYANALAGKGKDRALKLLLANRDYVAVFSNLDNDNTSILSAHLLSKLEEFVFALYGKRLQNFELLRYQLYCSKGGKVEPEALPPCKSTLALHVIRANYQAWVWKRAILQLPDVPSPDGHGWEAGLKYTDLCATECDSMGVGIPYEQPNELDQNAYATISESDFSDFEDD
eukprot:gene4100-20281_t